MHVQTKTVQLTENGQNEWVDLDLLYFKVIKRVSFNSDRKRMSILVHDKQDGLYKLYIKGADNMILDRLDPFRNDPKLISETKKFLHKASSVGYRTLLFGVKVFD